MTRYTPQWLQAGTFPAAVDRRLIGALWPTPASVGCAVTAGTGMTVNVAAGQVVCPTANTTGSVLCSSDAVETVTVPASAAQDRIDLIICRPRSTDIGTAAGDDFIFDIVTGTPAASPVPPATPAGTTVLAQVRVPTGSASVTAGNITDTRPANLQVAPPSSGRGTLAQASATTSSTTTTTNVDWFSAPAFTVDGTRRVRVNFNGWANTATANDTVALRLMEGATELQRIQLRLPASGGAGQLSFAGIWQGVPAAGPHTYKLNVILIAGTGAVNAVGNTFAPGILLVEDVGT